MNQVDFWESKWTNSIMDPIEVFFSFKTAETKANFLLKTKKCFVIADKKIKFSVVVVC